MSKDEQTAARSIGLALGEIRRQRGISQEELSLESGVHRTYISGIERGIRNPSLRTIADLLKPLGSRLEEFGALFDRHQAKAASDD